MKTIPILIIAAFAGSWIALPTSVLADDPDAIRQREEIRRVLAMETQASMRAISAKTNDTARMPAPLAAPNATPYHLTISEFAPSPNLPRDNPVTGEGV